MQRRLNVKSPGGDPVVVDGTDDAFRLQSELLRSLPTGYGDDSYRFDDQPRFDDGSRAHRRRDGS